MAESVMMFAQYCRIESKAGGVSCTRREFIRAARTLLTPKGRTCRRTRDARHAWLREGLAMRADARKQYVDVMRGNLYSFTRDAKTGMITQ